MTKAMRAGVVGCGQIARHLHVTAMFGHSGPEGWSPTGKWFFRRKEARFGAMADLGVHKADLVRPTACQVLFLAPPPASNTEDSWGLDISGAFARACLGIEKPFCTGEEGKKSLEVILAAEKAALTGRSVKLTK